MGSIVEAPGPEIVPDGYLEITFYTRPFPEALAAACGYTMKIPFESIRWWHRCKEGVLVCYPTDPQEFQYFPASNILMLEWKNISQEVVNKISAHRKVCNGCVEEQGVH